MVKGVYEEWKAVIDRWGNGERISLGNVSISLFSINNSDATRFNFRRMGNPVEQIYSGDYVKLTIDEELIMSDTPMEKRTNSEFIDMAHGNVLIAGLGIGLLLKNLIPKINSGEIHYIEVWEKNPYLIDLWKMAAQYLPVHDMINIIQMDVFDYARRREIGRGRFDSIYIDIWGDISLDNYEEMKRLRKGMRTFLRPLNPKAFIECWRRKDLIKKLRQE